MALAAVVACSLAFDATAASEALARWKQGGTPPLQAADENGRMHRLSDLRGKIVVVNFWATWCEPCRDEMPSLERLRKRMGDRIEVLAVNVAESPQRVGRFAAEIGIVLPVLYDRDGEIARRWNVRGYPTSFVVGPDGHIRYYYVGELDWARDDIVRTLEAVR